MAAGEDVVRRRERRGRHNAIDEVRVLAGGVLPPAAVLATRDFCRPVYEAGALVLHVLPAGPGPGRAVRGAQPDALLRRPPLTRWGPGDSVAW
jgi:hypothetical protein